LSCPEELFDFEVFSENPRPFYRFAKHLYFPLGQNERARPSDAHKLLALLEEHKMLLRVYSQNIDGLEQEAGLSPKRVVYAHGSLQWATCVKCKHRINSKEIEHHVIHGTIPRCQELPKPLKPSLKSSVPSPILPARGVSARLKKRLREDETDCCDIGVCGGVLKPGVTFFGETLHDNVRRTFEADRNKVDALIVMGTSLSV
jgi:NAD-dependent SIR2 family protein deacetylase